MGRKKRKHNTTNPIAASSAKKKQKNRTKFHHHRKRRERYWIEDCRDTPAKLLQSNHPAVTVLITRVELRDDHTYHKKTNNKNHGPCAQGIDGSTSKVGAEDTEKAQPTNQAATARIEQEKASREEEPSNGMDEQLEAPTAENDKSLLDDDKHFVRKTAEKAKVSAADNKRDNMAFQTASSKALPKGCPTDTKMATGCHNQCKNQNESETTKPGHEIEPEMSKTQNGILQNDILQQNNDDKVKHRKGGDVKGTEIDEAETIIPSPVNPAGDVQPNGNDKGIFVCIRRDASAKKEPKKFPRQNFKHLPDGDCGDGIKNPYPKHVVADKYWAQRHRLFSRFDDGIQLDQESWYSVTPEAIASHIASKMVLRLRSSQSNQEEGLVILDGFCGAGGNAIAFAKHEDVDLVICVDTDESKLRLAATNAQIYDIPDNKLLFIHANVCDVLQYYEKPVEVKASFDASDDKNIEYFRGFPLGGIELLFDQPRINGIFLSPPWGGVDYEEIGPRKFDLRCIHCDNNLSGEEILEHGYRALSTSSVSGSMAFFLPRNTNGLEIGRSASKVGITGTINMEQNLLNDKFKAVTIYMDIDKHDEGIVGSKNIA